MATWNIGKKNGMWKEGRSLASNGYMLVRVGVGHHLADSRGYAYEHRLVAESKIGRRLRAGEQVHHVNGDKSDNRPENLLVCESTAHHRLHHRTAHQALRLPGEENPTIECACGCGQHLLTYDKSGRPRRYVSGHNPSPSITAKLILQALEDGPKDLRYLSSLRGNPEATKVACSRMVKEGKIIRLKRGIYGRAN